MYKKLSKMYIHYDRQRKQRDHLHTRLRAHELVDVTKYARKTYTDLGHIITCMKTPKMICFYAFYSFIKKSICLRR